MSAAIIVAAKRSCFFQVDAIMDGGVGMKEGKG